MERNNENVAPNLHVREKTVLGISSASDHRDTCRDPDETTYQFPLGFKKKKSSFFGRCRTRRQRKDGLLPRCPEEPLDVFLGHPVKSGVSAGSTFLHRDGSCKLWEDSQARLSKYLVHSGAEHYPSSPELHLAGNPHGSRTDPSSRGRETGRGEGRRL